MRLIGLADIHGNTAVIDKISAELASADVVLVVGDITNFGRFSAARQVIQKIRRHCGAILAVSGNCDYRDVDAYLDQEDINLHGRGRIIGGLGFVGLGGSLITPFQTPNEYTESQLAAFLAAGRSALPSDLPLLLISHQPPIHTRCDRIRTGEHVGSQSVRTFIEQFRPMVCFTGHIHEAAGIDTIGPTKVINPGQLAGGRYAYADITDRNVLVELRSPV